VSGRKKIQQSLAPLSSVETENTQQNLAPLLSVTASNTQLSIAPLLSAMAKTLGKLSTLGKNYI
jgi:hypothetical protein